MRYHIKRVGMGDSVTIAHVSSIEDANIIADSLNSLDNGFIYIVVEEDFFI